MSGRGLRSSKCSSVIRRMTWAAERWEMWNCGCDIEYIETSTGEFDILNGIRAVGCMEENCGCLRRWNFVFDYDQDAVDRSLSEMLSGRWAGRPVPVGKSVARGGDVLMCKCDERDCMLSAGFAGNDIDECDCLVLLTGGASLAAAATDGLSPIHVIYLLPLTSTSSWFFASGLFAPWSQKLIFTFPGQ